MQDVRIKKIIFFIFSIITLILFISNGYWWYEREIERLEILSKDLVDDQFDMLIAAKENYSNDLKIINSYWHLDQLKLLTSEQEKKQIINILYEETRAFLDLKVDYDQFRILERSGMEILRIDRIDSLGVRSPYSSLQNKSDRYYFKNVMNMEKIEIYYSLLDLNIEHGELETPYKPTIRFALPLNAPNPDFFLILNINFSQSLNSFQRMNKNVEIDSYLINRRGFFLSSPLKNQEWGFMIEERSDQIIQSSTPAVWEELEQKDSGLVHLGKHFYVWRNIYQSDEESRWTILAEITPANNRIVRFLIPVITLLYLFINTIFLLVLNNYFRKKMTLKSIVEQKTFLETDLLEKKNMLRKAVNLQQSFIQKKIPEVSLFNIHNLFMPCDKLGGDFFSIIKRSNEEKMIIIIGDCTDHGMKASMDASLLSRLVEQNIESLFEDDRTDLFLNRIGQQYSKIADDDQFPTMLVLLINITTGEMFYSNANSELPYILRDDQVFKLKKVEGFHIGYFDEPEYKREHFIFKDKDRMFLYSDAVIDIIKENKSRLGYVGLENILNESSGSADIFFKSIIDRLKSENRKFPLDDDTTLILLEYKEIKEKEYRIHSREGWLTAHEEMKELLQEYDYYPDEIIQVCKSVDEIYQQIFPFDIEEHIIKTLVFKIKISCKEIELMIQDEGGVFLSITLPENEIQFTFKKTKEQRITLQI